MNELFRRGCGRLSLNMHSVQFWESIMRAKSMLHRGRKSTYDLIEPVLTGAETRTKGPKSRSTPQESPPDHLSPAMREWWNAVVAEHDLDRHRLHLLEAACGAWDRMEQAREAVAVHGLTYLSKDGDPRPRPEVAIERDARIAFARLLRDLDLPPPPQKYNAIGWPIP